VGTVSHFSSWNFDIPVDIKTFVNGYVFDCSGAPVPGIAVNVGPVVTYTNEFGFYESNVAPDLAFDILVSDTYNYGLASDVISIGGVVESDVLSVDDIILPCPAYVEGVVQDCDGNPIAANVYASWDTGGNMVYTTDGTFNIIVAGNESITLTAVSNDLFTGEVTLTSESNSLSNLSTPLSVCNEWTGCGVFSFKINGEPRAIIGESVNIIDNTSANTPMLSYSLTTETDYIFLVFRTAELQVGEYVYSFNNPHPPNSCYMKFDPIVTELIDSSGILIANTYQGSMKEGEGSMAITAITSDNIEGTFSGITTAMGTTFDITEGYFCLPAP
jgi:hypothetical protein